MKDKLKELMDMEIGTWAYHECYDILRVPGGWIWERIKINSIGGRDYINSTFVPEPKVEKHKKEERSVRVDKVMKEGPEVFRVDPLKDL